MLPSAGWMLGAQAAPPGLDAAREAFAAARAMLCADCGDDIDARGREPADAARPCGTERDGAGRGGVAAAPVGIAQAREAVGSVDGGTAITAPDAASAALAARR